MEINDVYFGNRSMPLVAYFYNYGYEISDTELGAITRENFEKYYQYVESNKPFWRSEGKILRKNREDSKISRKELAKYVGVCSQTIKNLEKGEPVRSRRMLVRSYETAMELINMKREKKNV